MKTKEMLNEWKSYLNKELLIEVSIKRFQEQHPDFDTSRFNSQLKGNTDYLDIISNTINSGEINGSFYQTENQYTVLFYYKQIGSLYDRVIGVGNGYFNQNR